MEKKDGNMGESESERLIATSKTQEEKMGSLLHLPFE
jgi:hypothetical protein